MIISSSINFPTVILLPTVCYFFSREATSEKYDPGSLSHIIFLCDLFSFAFIFRFIKPKIQKYLSAIYSYLFYLAFDLSISTNLPHVLFPILRHRTLKGIFVCRGCLRCVAWFSYWFDNLDFIFEGNTYCHCAASSLRLWGNTNVASSDISALEHVLVVQI